MTFFIFCQQHCLETMVVFPFSTDMKFRIDFIHFAKSKIILLLKLFIIET